MAQEISKIKIEMSTVNAAFEDPSEVSRILFLL